MSKTHKTERMFVPKRKSHSPNRMKTSSSEWEMHKHRVWWHMADQSTCESVPTDGPPGIRLCLRNFNPQPPRRFGRPFKKHSRIGKIGLNKVGHRNRPR